MRALHNLRPADALQMAACLQSGATAFLSNDRALRRIGEIQVLLLDHFLAGQFRSRLATTGTRCGTGIDSYIMYLVARTGARLLAQSGP